MRKRRFSGTLINALCFLLGAAFYAAAITVFVKPNGLVTGGFSGLALIGNALFGAPVGVSVFVLNIPLFILGYKKLGKGFILRTTLATALVSVLIEVFERYVPPFHCQSILASLAGGILCGSGLALILVRGGSTGGADIISKLVHLKYPHIALGRVILCFDIAVITLSAIIFKNIENALYSVLMIAVSSAALDYFIYGTKSGKLLLIITDKGSLIAEKVNTVGGRGATLLPATGAYTGKARHMLLCAVRPHEIGKIYDIVARYDKNAFLTLLDAREIKGLGFYRDYE